MAVHTFDLSKVEAASGGSRRDYIKPGTYTFEIVKYDDKDSKAGNVMHTFTYAVASRGDEKGKKITDYMAMPKSAKDSDYGKAKLKALLIACGVKIPSGPFKFDPARLVKKQVVIEIVDKREDAQTVNGRTYPARTISDINEYLTPEEARRRARAVRDDDEEEDDLDDEELDEEEDDEEPDDDEEDVEDDEDEEDEPAPARRRGATATATRTGTRAATHQAAAPSRNGTRAASNSRRAPADAVEDDDDDFFDDDDEEPEPAPARRRAARR